MASSFTGATESNATVLDTLAQQVIDATTANSKASAEVGGIGSIGETIESSLQNLILMVCYFFFLVIAGAYIMLAKVFISILAVVAPLFIAMALFPISRGFAMAWFNQVINYSLLFLLLSVTSSIFVDFLMALLQSSITPEGILSQSFVGRSIFSTGIFIIILMKLPELASGLAGGVTANGFGNAASVVTTSTRMGKMLGSGKSSSGGSGGSFTKGRGASQAERGGKGK